MQPSRRSSRSGSAFAGCGNVAAKFARRCHRARRIGRSDRRRRGSQTFRTAHILAGISALLTLAVVIRIVPDREAFAGFSCPTIVFFVVGMNTLAAGLAYLAAWVDSDRAAALRGAGLTGASRLGVRNAARHRSRSVLSTGLIASATFLIVAIAAGHRNPAVELPDKSSGNGGFTLVAESTIPVLYDLNTKEGRSKLDLDDDASSQSCFRRWQAVSPSASIRARMPVASISIKRRNRRFWGFPPT